MDSKKSILKMKRYLLFVVCGIVALCGAAEDRFYIEDFSMEKGETRTVEMLLDNAMEYTAFQCDIYLPEGFTANRFALTSRKHSTHTLSATVQPDGAIRLLSYSLKLKPYTGNSGALVTFDITASEDFSGSAVISLRNTMFSDLIGAEVPLNDEQCNVTVLAGGLPGDVNDDGMIGISDAVDLVDYLLNGDATAINIVNADVDGNGTIGIADVTEIIDLMLQN